VTWGTHVQSFVFLGLFGFRVRADVRDIRQTDDGRRSSLNAPGAGGIITWVYIHYTANIVFG